MVLACFAEFYTLFIIFHAIHVVISENETTAEEVPLPQTKSPYGIVFASVLYRHGDRTPVKPYKNDPWGKLKFWPVKWGQLTNIGKQQHFELGKYLKNRYETAGLLTSDYDPDEINIRSTDVDRTLMSAMSNLAGMFPPRNEQVWNEDIKWQPIPVHTLPEHMDNMLAGKKPCPVYDDEYARVLQSEEVKKLKDSYSDVFELVNANAGQEVDTIQHLDWIRSDLLVERLNSLKLPPWTEKEGFLDRLDEVGIHEFVLPTSNKKLARFKIGPLLKDIIDNMNKTLKDKSFKRTIQVYSGHDETISALMNAMGIFNMVYPPYAACLIIELRNNTAGENKVVIFYRNESLGEPFPLTIPGCDLFCPLDEFIKLMEPVTPNDWEAECKKSNVLLVVGLVVLIILVILVIAAVLYFLLRKKLAVSSSGTTGPENVNDDATSANTTRPTTKPTTKPTTQPTTKPTTQPTTKPTTQPTKPLTNPTTPTTNPTTPTTNTTTPTTA